MALREQVPRHVVSHRRKQELVGVDHGDPSRIHYVLLHALVAVAELAVLGVVRVVRHGRHPRDARPHVGFQNVQRAIGRAIVIYVKELDPRQQVEFDPLRLMCERGGQGWRLMRSEGGIADPLRSLTRYRASFRRRVHTASVMPLLPAVVAAAAAAPPLATTWPCGRDTGTRDRWTAGCGKLRRVPYATHTAATNPNLHHRDHDLPILMPYHFSDVSRTSPHLPSPRALP